MFRKVHLNMYGTGVCTRNVFLGKVCALIPNLDSKTCEMTFPIRPTNLLFYKNTPLFCLLTLGTNKQSIEQVTNTM